MISFLFEGRRRVVLIIIALLVILLLNVIENPMRSWAYKVAAPVQSYFWQAGDDVNGFFSGGQVKQDSETLLFENMALLQTVGELKDVKEENDELRKALAFGIEEDFVFIEGQVLWKDPSSDTLIIRSGTGVEEGMPVTTPEKVAVGIVEEVMGEFSRIRLLSHTESSVDVVATEERIGGVIKGEGKFNTLLDFLPHSAEITEGDIVITSQLGGIFPKNFLVGRVAKVIKSDLEPFQRAQVDQFFNIKLHHMLLIITNYQTL